MSARPRERSVAAMLKGHTLALAGSALLFAAAPAQAAGPQCGATIVRSTTLRADFNNCPGDGLIIGADGITLDLDGHTISGTGAAGLRVVGRRGVTIRDGRVEGFTNNLLLDGASGNVVRNLRVRRSESRGVVVLNGSDGNRFEAVDSGEGRSGFRIEESDHNVLTRVTGSSNMFSGVTLVAADDNVVQESVFNHNGGAGVSMEDGSDRNRILANNSADGGMDVFPGDRNVIAGNRIGGHGVVIYGDRNLVAANTVADLTACPEGCGIGIGVEGGTANLVTGNLITRAAWFGIRVDEYEPENAPPVDTVIRANIVGDAASDGIAIGTNSGGRGTISGTVIEGNLVTGSALDGVHAVVAGTTLTRNVALHNARVGIEGVDGVIDGGGNFAHGNGDPLQCLKVSCR
jgi:hypothetical protein